MEQAEFRMPATGEGWRHYRQSPGLYTVIGMAVGADGSPMVVYTPLGWRMAQLPPIYVRSLAEWLQIIDTGFDAVKVARGEALYRFVPRFRFEREVWVRSDVPFHQGDQPCRW